MKKLSLFLLSALAFSLSTTSFAQEKINVLSTQQLVNECKAPVNTEPRTFCVGFTKAVYETYLATRHPQHAVPYICINPIPRRDDVINGFVKWSNENPEARDKPAAGGLSGISSHALPLPQEIILRSIHLFF